MNKPDRLDSVLSRQRFRPVFDLLAPVVVLAGLGMSAAAVHGASARSPAHVAAPLVAEVDGGQARVAEVSPAP